MMAEVTVSPGTEESTFKVPETNGSEVTVTLNNIPSPSTDSGLGTSENSPIEENKLSSTETPAVNGDSSHGPGKLSGPDVVEPADSFVTCQRDKAVKLRIGEGLSGRKPLSVVTVFQSTVRKAATSMALAVKRNNQWVKWTFKEYYDDVVRAAKGFIKLGLEPYHGVGIIGFNSPEWFISDLAAIFACGLGVGIYTTNTPDACHYVAENSKANIIVVENNQQLQKILQVRDRLPHLKAIIQYVGELAVQVPDVYTWADFMELYKEVPDAVLEERIRMQAPNKCCTLIYTSGTTGNPKGVMLSQDNITWTATVAGEAARLKFGEDIMISYLPLSHIAGQLMDIYATVMYGTQVWFAQPDALKGSLGQTLKEVRPTQFLGVPRVWEKFQEKMQAVGKNTTGLKKKIATWAKGIGLQGNLSLMNGLSKKKKVPTATLR